MRSAVKQWSLGPQSEGGGMFIQRRIEDVYDEDPRINI